MGVLGDPEFRGARLRLHLRDSAHAEEADEEREGDGKARPRADEEPFGATGKGS